ncbi:MAG: GNAT family N-acetyltransferase [Burkholderia sp.]|jgi:GNAT superfamily N-acetyltransferase|uniref:GNAT family N-acetyltransferase n=1 Tax=Burkholderia sp. TaxID=36773 RepID=UPI002828ED09|nr:GNAT family N-acetyltransferase [Burkholderia sp.]MDR0243334.1 GNAT family N-acetyltransferase [Burkholderia sp.]
MHSFTEMPDVSVAAWHESIDAFCRLQDVGHVESGTQGTKSIYSGAPVSVLNGVISMRRQPDVEEMRFFSEPFRDCALPWSIQTRGDGQHAEAIRQLAGEYGLTQCMALPFMTKRLDRAEAPVGSDGRVVVRRVAAADSERYNSALAAGYDAPEQVFRRLSAPGVLEADGMMGFLVEYAGIPVATSFGILCNDQVGVFNVSTLPAYRRRGYARAATRAVLTAACANGAHTAFLHCTPAGRHVYESIGFAVREEWQVYVGQ